MTICAACKRETWLYRDGKCAICCMNKAHDDFVMAQLALMLGPPPRYRQLELPFPGPLPREPQEPAK